jgi:GNAT superfamily N-acetyltransferase
MTVEIREVTQGDLPSVLALYTQLGMDDGNVLTLDEAKRIFGRMQTYPDYKIYVALKNALPAGTFALLIMENLGHRGAPSGIIEDVVVRKDLRGQGIGKKMMDFAMQKCRERGCYKIALSSNMQRTEAHKFYKSLRYRLHGYSFFTDLYNEDIRP